jgi:hypothetical protein
LIVLSIDQKLLSRKSVFRRRRDETPAAAVWGFKPHVHQVMAKGSRKDGQWVEIDRLEAVYSTVDREEQFKPVAPF